MTERKLEVLPRTTDIRVDGIKFAIKEDWELLQYARECAEKAGLRLATVRTDGNSRMSEAVFEIKG